MVAIKDMEMPSCCGLCERYLLTCEYRFENAQTMRHPNCPLVEIEERKVGEWITNSDYPDRLICSCCNSRWDMWKWESKNMHFCPNCGCRMKGEE